MSDGPPVLRRRDFEKHLGNGVSLIYEGHPCYCPLQEVHDPHWHYYAYRDRSGEIWNGRVICDGDLFEFAPREEPAND